MSTADSSDRHQASTDGRAALDPLETVRRHPEWYFRGGRFDASEATGLLVGEAFRGGASEVTVRSVDGWVIVTGDRDWLDRDLAAFVSPQIDPHGGVNSSRVEVALVAFCDAVITKHADGRTDAWPAHARDQLAGDWRPDAGRAVAFLPPTLGDEAQHHEGTAASVRRSHLRLATAGGESEVATAVESAVRKSREHE